MGTRGPALVVAARAHELRGPTDRDVLAWLVRQRKAAVALTALSTALSAVFPKAAVVFYLALSLLLIVEPVWGLRRRGSRAS